MLYNLVLDCETYRLSEEEAKEYVRKRTNGKIELSHVQYYRIKRHIHSDPEIQNWFNHFTRIGFVIEHRKRIEEMELLQKTLLQEYYKELEKPKGKGDKVWLLKLSERIESQNKRLSELTLGNPIIAKIKKQVDIKYGETTAGISTDSKNIGNSEDLNRLF